MQNQSENALFFVKLREILNTTFIMFETKLEDLFYNLAESPVIYSIVEKCLEGFDYNNQKQKNLINPSVNNKGAFISPTDRRDFIAFSFSVLYDLYDKKMPFTDLIDLYFDGNGYKEKFDKFKEQVLYRLYNELLSVVEDLNSLYTLKSNGEKQIIKDKKENIASLKNYISEQKIKFEDKEYLIYFIDAIIKGDSEEVCYTAIKYILSNYKRGEEILKEITGALSK